MGYNVVNTGGNPIPKYAEPIKSPAEVDYDRAIAAADSAAAITKAKAREELKRDRIKAEMDELAYRQKCYHDALRANGFDEDQAWDIFMKSIPQQPIYYGMDWGFGASLGSYNCGG